MDDVKDNDKTTAVSDETAEAKTALVAVPADDSPAATGNGEAPKLADASAQTEPASDAKTRKVATKEEPPVQATYTPPRTSNDKESELTTLSGLLLVVLAGAMFYVGTVVFAKDSLLFFAGIFLYMLIAPPGTYAQGKSKMASFTKEVAMAFTLTLVLFLGLKSILPAGQDQAQFFTVLLAILGFKLVHWPYYNTKDDED